MTTITLKKTFAALPQVERGKSVKIYGDPKGENLLYCHGQSVFIRNVEDPSVVDIYTEHAKQATVARYSPSRFYIASCDITGKVRIWDTVNPEHILKAEYPVLGGEIRDLDWSPDSTKIILVGNGREKFAHVFTMDTGTSTGEINGHSKIINSCAFRQVRPFRIITGSEDFSVGFFEGPPFKFKRTQTFHQNFVNVVKFSPGGNVALSGGSGGHLYKYDGKTLDGEEKMEIGSPAHSGGIYDMCFSPQGTEILTASGDKTAKVFDVESGSLLMNFTSTGKEWQNMQLGCLWQGDNIITVNGYGHLIYHDQQNAHMPKRVIKGHIKPITALAVTSDGASIFSGGQDGIIWWDVATGNNDTVSGPGHSNEVTDMVIDGDNLISVGVDDTLRFTSVSALKFSGGDVKLDSQPKGVDCHNGTIVVACIKHLVVFEGNHKMSSTALTEEARCISIHPSGSTVAVGFKNKICIYPLASGVLGEPKEVEAPGEVNALDHSPDGAHLAAAVEKRMVAFSTTDYKVLSKAETHTASVRCVAWSPDSTRYVSSALDSKIILWDDVNESFKTRPSIKAHTMSHANKIAWLDKNTVVTAGQDSNVKIFTVSD